MEIGNTVSKILQKYISSKIPKAQTNVFWMMFNGIDSLFTYIELLLRLNKRERNILTAQSIASLRSLAANNGFEPTLKIPSKGTVLLTASPKLFARSGFPLYLPPYAVFKNETSGLFYYFASNNVLKIENNSIEIPLIEGEIFSTTHKSTGQFIERFYISSDNIADKSLVITVGNDNFMKVNSFSDNENINDNKQFIVKYSNKPNSPIVVYVKGTKLNDILNISYRLTFGEGGNIPYSTTFSTESLLNSNGENVEISSDEMTIQNISGFELGSNGSDANTLRSAIGFNHGSNLLFDAISYQEFINKYSNLLLQKIVLSENNKSINNIYIGNKQYINETDNILVNEYIDIVNTKKYLVTNSNKEQLDKILLDNEFAMSSHNLFDIETNKFSLQILFNNQAELELHKNDLIKLVYLNFGKFLYDKYHQINFEVLFYDFMESNNINFEYTIFNELIETQKLTNNTKINTPYIIKHDNHLPILKGDFNICNIDFTPVKLFSDINIVSK